VKIFAREGSTLFATLTAAEFDRIDAHRERFAIRPEHRQSGVGPGSELDLAAWFDAAEKIKPAREGIEGLRDLFQRQANALFEALDPTPTGPNADDITLGHWLEMIEAVEVKCRHLRKLREHFEAEIVKLDAALDEIGPPELEVAPDQRVQT
jgi:hypothetical protein